MDTEAPHATQSVSENDITNDSRRQNFNTRLLDSTPRKSGHDITSHDWWRTSQSALLAMFGFLLIGALTAISHHFFYSYLNNQATDKAVVGQIWAIQIGTAFAYLFRTALVAATSVVYAQAFWFIVRRYAFEIGTLDDFFDLLNNPLRLCNRSLYGRASILLGLAIVSWLLPISAFLAPGALTGLFTL